MSSMVYFYTDHRSRPTSFKKLSNCLSLDVNWEQAVVTAARKAHACECFHVLVSGFGNDTFRRVLGENDKLLLL